MKFEFTEEYFKDEMRSGFLVTECMKRYWAASLKTLEIFDEICSRHNLSYWADCGTLLGAFRHHGFIPWDDDIDLAMPRTDYNNFLKIAQKELPEGYFVSTTDSKNHSYNGITVIINHTGTLFSADILGTYYNCPFPVGFDLYPYDDVPKDEKENTAWRLEYLKGLNEVRSARKLLDSKGITDYSAIIEREEELEKIAGKYAGSDSDELIRFIFHAIYNTIAPVKKSWCRTQYDMPFETGTIPVPLCTEEVLISEFGGQYYRSVRAKSAHDYPLYRRDIAEMITMLKGGGISLNDLPPMLQYIRREADLREIPY